MTENARPALLVREVRPLGGDTVDLLAVDGIIEAIGPGLTAPAGAEVLAGGGKVLLPGLVDAHTHLDKTLWGLPWLANTVGPSLLDKIENERRYRRESGVSPHEQSLRLAREAIARGTTHIRTHVDIDTECRLGQLEGVLATREALRGAVDMQIVAFPQSGLLCRPGTLELIEAGLRAGADVVGGLDPCGIDRDPAGQLDAVFDLAVRYSVPVDIHLHDPGELGAFQLELIAERTRVNGLRGRVIVSHAFCLGDVPEARYAALVDLLLESDIAIMTHGPGGRPFPPIARLLAAGVRMCSGNDGVRDTWGPYGNADMLERAWILSYRSNFRRDDEIALALHLATTGGADACGFPAHALAVGHPADFVLVEGATPAEAVMLRAPRAHVVKRGRLVASGGRCLG